MTKNSENGSPVEDSSKGPIVMVIRAYPDGVIDVEGPIDNAVLCYGLLQVAMDKVRAHQAEKMTKHGGVMNFMRNGHK